jgi:hypothetical protein
MQRTASTAIALAVMMTLAAAGSAGAGNGTFGRAADETPVLGVFYATPLGRNTIMLRWTVSPDVLQDIMGFDIYRATSVLGADAPGCKYEKLNGDRLEATSPGMYEDDTVSPGIVFWYELRAVFVGGSEDLVAAPVSVTIPGGRPVALMMKGPNPFTGETRLEFDVPDGGRSLRLGVYTCRGALVKVLVDGAVEPGRHPAVWDGTDARGRAVATGVYFVRLETGFESAAAKVVCLR